MVKRIKNLPGFTYGNRWLGKGKQRMTIFQNLFKKGTYQTLKPGNTKVAKFRGNNIQQKKEKLRNGGWMDG